MPGEVSAEDTARAKELFENGRGLYAEARYEDAIAAWTEGYRLTAMPDFLFNVANAHERLGNHDEAIDALQRYRAFAEPDERESLLRRIDNLGDLRDRQEAKTAPVPAPTVTVPVETVETPEAKPGSGKRLVGGVLAGVGVATIVTGAVLGSASSAAGSSAESQCVSTADGLICPRGAAADVDRQKSLALGADLAYIGGAVLTTVGVVLFVTPSGTSVHAGPTHIGVRGRF